MINEIIKDINKFLRSFPPISNGEIIPAENQATERLPIISEALWSCFLEYFTLRQV